MFQAVVDYKKEAIWSLEAFKLLFQAVVDCKKEAIWSSEAFKLLFQAVVDCKKEAIWSSDAFKQSGDTNWYQAWAPINDKGRKSKTDKISFGFQQKSQDSESVFLRKIETILCIFVDSGFSLHETLFIANRNLVVGEVFNQT